MSVFNGAAGHEINSEAMKAASCNITVRYAGPARLEKTGNKKCLLILKFPLAARMEECLHIHGTSQQVKAV